MLAFRLPRSLQAVSGVPEPAEPDSLFSLDNQADRVLGEPLPWLGFGVYFGYPLKSPISASSWSSASSP